MPTVANSCKKLLILRLDGDVASCGAVEDGIEAKNYFIPLHVSSTVVLSKLGPPSENDF